MPDFANAPEGGVPLPSGFAPFEFGGDVSDEMHGPAIPMAMENIRANCARGLPTLKWQSKARPETMLICGGGPSIKEHIGTLKDEIAKGGKVFAINDTHDWLLDQGITPDYFGMCEIEPWPVDFITKPQKETTYCLPSLAHTTAFDRLQDFNVLLWHCWMGIGEDPEIIKAGSDNQLLISGGEAMSIRAIPLSMVMGYRNFQMFGVDGSFPEDAPTHAYYDRRKDIPDAILHPREFWHGGKVFWSHHCYARQMLDLIRYCRIHGHMFTLKCHGDGLVQHAHKMAFPQQYDAHQPLMEM